MKVPDILISSENWFCKRTMNPHTCIEMELLPTISTYLDSGDTKRMERLRGFLNCSMRQASQKNGEMREALLHLHDHKGILIAYWARAEEAWKEIVEVAWLAEGESNVQHLVVLPTEKHY